MNNLFFLLFFSHPLELSILPLQLILVNLLSFLFILMDLFYFNSFNLGLNWILNGGFNLTIVFFPCFLLKLLDYLLCLFLVEMNLLLLFNLFLKSKLGYIYWCLTILSLFLDTFEPVSSLNSCLDNFECPVSFLVQSPDSIFDNLLLLINLSFHIPFTALWTFFNFNWIDLALFCLK